MQIFHDKDADQKHLKGKTVAVIGFGSQGCAQALCLRDSGVNVIVGESRELAGKPNPSLEMALENGFDVYDISEASTRAHIIHILLPDEHHASVYREKIEQNMTEGKTLCCSPDRKNREKDQKPFRTCTIKKIRPSASWVNRNYILKKDEKNGKI